MPRSTLRFAPATALVTLALAAASQGCTASLSIAEPDVGVDVSSAPTSTGNASPMVQDSNAAAALAIDTDTLFWLDRGGSITDSVQAMWLGDGNVTTLYLASPDATAAIEDLVADATNVYITQVSDANGVFTSEVKAIPRSGGKPVVLASGKDVYFDLSVADGYVYYSNGNTLFRVPTTGGAVETVDGGGAWTLGAGKVGGLFTDQSAVYWTEVDAASQVLSDATLVTRGTADARTSPLADYTSPSTPLLASSGTSLFWVTEKDGQSYIVQAPMEGGQPTLLTEVGDSVVGLLADEANVYVLTSQSLGGTQELLEVPIHGGTTFSLESGIPAPAEGDARHALAQDESTVYFVQSGAVLSVPK